MADRFLQVVVKQPRRLTNHFGEQAAARALSVDRLRELADLTASRSRRLTAGTIAYWIAVGLLFVVPVARTFEYLKSGWYLFAWAVLYGIKLFWDWLRLGSFVERGNRPVVHINQAVAGAIDQLARTLVQSADRRLGESESHAVAVALLHRIRDYSEYAFEVEEGVRLRATLAVPICSEGSSKPKSIRVWCYDATHDDRRWTNLPLLYAGEPLPGAPTSLLYGKIEIIDDVWDLKHLLADAAERRFRSILSIPIKAGGPSGKVLAVLNIDGERAKLFEAQRVERVFVPMVAPVVNVLGLVLLTRKEELPYEFGH